jgi:hypothetical protein
VLSSTEGGTAIELDGTPGLRTERTYDADAERGVDYPSRRVEYILPAPGRADSWLLSTFSTFGAGSPDDGTSKLLCALFDAIMGTFRWERPQEEA